MIEKQDLYPSPWRHEWRRRPQLRVLYSSGYAENVLTDQEGLEAEIQLLHKSYQRAEPAHKNSSSPRRRLTLG